jgi:ADP-heptose:LPS heptosyltransferase
MKILWIRPDSVGDAVLSLGMLPRIKAHYDNAEIIVVCQSFTRELYEDIPCVDGIISFDRKDLINNAQGVYNLMAEVRNVRADLCLHPVYSREPLGDLLVGASEAEERIGWLGDTCNQNNIMIGAQFYSILFPRRHIMNELETNREFLLSLDIDGTGLKPEVYGYHPWKGPWKGKYICLFANAQYAIKDYHRFAEALKPVVDGGEYLVMALGTNAQWENHHKILKQLECETLNLCGATTLKQVAFLLSGAKLAVGVDTAFAHIACAVNTPQVIVMSGGHGARFLPYSDLTTVVKDTTLGCVGCNFICRHKETLCLTGIAPEEIAEAIRGMLK